jgi:hypothetical protein
VLSPRQETVDGRVEILLEVDPASDPIKGLLRDRRGDTHDFHGWLQLMAAVDTARTIEPERSRSNPKGDR